jgi:hypothetical protein
VPDDSPACSTKPAFSRSRFNARLLAADLLLTGTGSSLRPFALPDQLRLSAPPSRGQRSRPATSDPQPSLPRPVRSCALLPPSVCPDAGRFAAHSPLPLLLRLLPIYLKTFTPLRDFYIPRDQSSASIRPAPHYVIDLDLGIRGQKYPKIFKA